MIPYDLDPCEDSDSGNTWRMANLEYAPGRAVDLYGDPEGRTALLWHGMQSNARGSVRRLAEALAGHGFGVVVPDWDSHAADRGRADLLRSAAYAGSHGSGEPIVVVGWSMGGAAAADLTLHATDVDVDIAHTVCLAGAFTATWPITGSSMADASVAGGTAAAGRTPFTLLHGLADDIVCATVSGDFAATLEVAGWPVSVVPLDTDHGAIAGARYDPVEDRYEAADDAATLAVVADVAGSIAKFTGERVIRAAPGTAARWMT